MTVINARVVSADLINLRFIRDAKLCADGIRVAYEVSRTDQEENSEIWIRDLSNGTRERLPYQGKAACPRRSCDGSRLVFVGGRADQNCDRSCLVIDHSNFIYVRKNYNSREIDLDESVRDARPATVRVFQIALLRALSMFCSIASECWSGAWQFSADQSCGR